MKNPLPAGLIALGLILLSASLTLGVVNTFPRDEISNADYQLARSATWIIECPKGDGNKECGTAVQVARGIFLTAAHITEAAQKPVNAEREGSMFYVNQSNKRFPVDSVLYEHNDVAIISVPGADCPCVPIGPLAPKVNDEVFTAGYPLLNYRSRSTLHTSIIATGLIQEELFPVNTVDAKPLPFPWYLTSVRVSPGNSGGGLFHKQGGRLYVVGVASAHPDLPLGFMQGNKYFHLGLFATWASVMEAVEAVRAPSRL